MLQSFVLEYWNDDDWLVDEKAFLEFLAKGKLLQS